MHLEPWQWALVVAGAFLVGVSKTGIVGIGVLFVAIFANVLPARQATGFVLPLLIFGDVIAVASYRQHTVWSHLWRLFPSTALGVLLGTLALGQLDDAATRRLVGGIILAMSALHVWRKLRARHGRQDEELVTSAPPGFAVAAGVLAGFTTQVANAAGPVMVLYLLAMRLPKMEFLGTGAVFFLCLNLFKAPFMAGLGMITAASFCANLLLAPAVVAGALAGRWLVHRINQRWFELIALALTLAAGVKLLF
ncbi:MAG TPA: sulfite exporter TauE/SafE family protein [Opitutaceae bacterium]|nr:sulfite exporter TauE/SafE family protein [Opitutaceae bacterium]